MEIRRVTVGRTYNTLHYTSQRFEIEVELNRQEEWEEIVYEACNALHRVALVTMREMGVHHYQASDGGVYPTREAALQDTDEGDVDEIPF